IGVDVFDFSQTLLQGSFVLPQLGFRSHARRHIPNRAIQTHYPPVTVPDTSSTGAYPARFSVGRRQLQLQVEGIAGNNGGLEGITQSLPTLRGKVTGALVVRESGSGGILVEDAVNAFGPIG